MSIELTAEEKVTKILASKSIISSNNVTFDNKMYNLGAFIDKERMIQKKLNQNTKYCFIQLIQ